MGRILGIAQTTEVFLTSYGVLAACETARRRRGEWFDPDLVDALTATEKDTGFWRRVTQEDLPSQLAPLQPDEPVMDVDDAGLDLVTEAFARVIDAKSPWTSRHSEGVSEVRWASAP